MKEAQKTEIQGMYKLGDGILLNKDDTSLHKYKREKDNLKKINSIEKDLSFVKNDIIEIKQMLKELVK